MENTIAAPRRATAERGMDPIPLSALPLRELAEALGMRGRLPGQVRPLMLGIDEAAAALAPALGRTPGGMRILFNSGRFPALDLSLIAGARARRPLRVPATWVDAIAMGGPAAALKAPSLAAVEAMLAHLPERLERRHVMAVLGIERGFAEDIMAQPCMEARTGDGAHRWVFRAVMARELHRCWTESLERWREREA